VQQVRLPSPAKETQGDGGWGNRRDVQGREVLRGRGEVSSEAEAMTRAEVVEHNTELQMCRQHWKADDRADRLNWNALPQPIDRGMLDQPVELRPEWEFGIEHTAPVEDGELDEDWFEFVATESRRAAVGVSWLQTKVRK
jgi:hypothetical protein